MKRQLFAGVTAVALMVSAQAVAQSVTVELYVGVVERPPKR